jgi:hypothetical protein
MRASHADREQVIETLKAAFVQGRLDRDQFDLRVSQTFASRTYAELATLIADIPARLTTARPPVPAQVQGEQPLLRARPGDHSDNRGVYRRMGVCVAPVPSRGR